MSKAVEQALLQAAKVVEEQLDAEIDRLDAMQGDDLEEFRRKRLQEMKKEASQKEEWLNKGHGQYTELSGEKEFFEECKANERVVCHFYRDTTMRCKIVDKHLYLLAPKHLEAKFVRINVERAPFLCERLPIRVLPTIASVIGGKTKDYIKGFDDLGGHDDFATEVLEWRLGCSTVIDYSGNILEPPTAHRPQKKILRAEGKKTIRGAEGSDSDSDD